MREGDWIQTFTGIKFYPLDPDPAEINVEDIAHALSLQCRFGGHCKEFYSVAEHSCRVCRLVPTLAALLHDAAEAYLIDLPRPIKWNMPQYVEAEARLERAMGERFGINPADFRSPKIKQADNVLLATEQRDLMKIRRVWESLEGVVPLPETIEPWSVSRAEETFLYVCKDLLSGKR